MLNKLRNSLFEIKNLKCTNCFRLIKKCLLELPGIYGVYLTFGTKLVSIVYDSTIGDVDLLVKTLTEIGFNANYVNNYSFNYL